MSGKRKRVFRHLREQLKEIDYSHKLSKEELEWVTKFYHEYYQCDFEENSIHPASYKKECAARNYASMSQLHSVGELILNEAMKKAYLHQTTSNAQRYYTPHDYSTFHEQPDNEEDLGFFQDPLQEDPESF